MVGHGWLVKRLDSAIREEIKQSPDSVSDSISKKRERGEENGNSNGSEKIKAVDKFWEMGVRQLREEAARLGYSTIGSKKELLERLCSASPSSDAIEAKVEEIAQNKEETATKQSVDSVNIPVSKKRERGDDNGDYNGSEKMKAVDKFRVMGVRQLREEAARLGLSTSGSKKELLERLCSNSSEYSLDAIEEEEFVEKEKIVTATKKGATVLDQWLPDHVKSEFHVLQQGDEIYDAMRNQTNVGDNNNKCYVVQVLESDDGGRFMVYYRWGRVGIKGQDKLQGPYTLREIVLFKNLSRNS